VSGAALVARTTSAEGTRSLAAALAPLARPGDVILLVGGLGAGKTTFAQGFARGLGIEGPVTSPTFTLVRQYRCPPPPTPGPGPVVGQLLHADVYRLDTLGEVADLALPELVEDAAVALVEWGDVAAPVLGDTALWVELAAEGDGEGEPDASPGGSGGPGGTEPGRRITVHAEGSAWESRRAELTAALAPYRGEVR
jgi:tRNA threonylcarbamoyladenosine biosynthesis protein TsaE